jgi:nucleoside-diphosphate-sugar epimerase
MTGKRILLAGASGFIGKRLVLDLKNRDFQVRGISRRPVEWKADIEWMSGDMTESDFVTRAVEGSEIVVNAAGKTGNFRDEKNIKEFFRVNRDAAGKLARTAHRGGARKFIHISSTGVFGHGEGEYFEDTPCEPMNPYEKSKYEGEAAVLAEATSRMSVIVVRPSNVFGEGHPWNKLLTWFRSILKGITVLASPPSDHWVNYVYIGDVTRSVAEFASANDGAGANRSLYIVNTPATLQEFHDASARALVLSRKPLVLPRQPLEVVAAFLDAVSSITRWRYPLTRDKVKELFNQQIFVAGKLKSIQSGFPYFGLGEGLSRTCMYYRERGLL